MPKSNKKRPPAKPPPHQTMFMLSHSQTSFNGNDRSEYATNQLLMDETSNMLSRAIKSANQHGINLEPGSSNPGNGDCAFEAIIQNNNDRPCFKEKFLMSIDYYRRLWVNDMANRTINSELNIYTNEEWNEGWKQMLIPRTYERGIFGDLMIPGIACGVKKLILIFNTNENSPHDPIYVVTPSRFNVAPDTAIPIVLAYNMVHYESLHPCTERDIQATVDLVTTYLEGRYQFCRKDLPFLLDLTRAQLTESKSSTEMLNNFSPTNASKLMSFEEKCTNPQKKTKLDRNLTKDVMDLEEIDNFLDCENERECKDANFTDLLYKLNGEEIEHRIKVDNGCAYCPFCSIRVKNIKLHFKKIKNCGSRIELDPFLQTYNRYEKQVKNEKARERMKNLREKKKKESAEASDALKEKERQRKRNERERRKNKSEDSLETLKEDNRQNVRKWRKKRTNESGESLEALKENNRQDVKNFRVRKYNTIDTIQRLKNFCQKVIFGPIFICSCCKRKLFKNGVNKITSHFREMINSKKQGSYELIIPRQVHIRIMLNGSDDLSGYYICHTCKSSLSQMKCPSMAETNGLMLIKLNDDCYLTELENNLIARTINFQYIYFLPKSRWAATKKQMISVPVTPETIIETSNQLPRLPKEAGLVPIQLKRKKEYEGCHQKELIDPDKVHRAIALLKNSGNKYYQFDHNPDEYRKKCKETDRMGHNLIFGGSDIETSSDDEESESENEEEIKERKYLNEDPVRKHQFDHNRNTCMTNDYPEIFLDDNGKQNLNKEDFSFAPAEGNRPMNLLNETDWDIKSWPTLLPDGKCGLHHKRKVRLTDQNYFVQRILNQDARFSKSTGYVFAAAAYIEQKQLSSKANISFMRGKKTERNGIAEYELNDAFTVFEGVRNTPKYWKKVKYDMIAKLENIGPFHFFFTLSCGDTRWDENFSTFLVENGYTVEYEDNQNGTLDTMVRCNEGKKPLEKFLEENIDESLHEMIRTNVLTATRTFHNRVVAFRDQILFGANNPMSVKHISYRVEFQGRGAAHIHGTIWLNLRKIEKLPQFEKNGKHLTDAFRKLRDDSELNEAEKDAIAILTDEFVTCSLNPATVGNKAVEIALEVNCHRCTKKCEGKCKYGFPRFPLKETLVVDKNEIGDSDDSVNKTSINYEKIIYDVKDILTDKEKIQMIFEKHPIKGETGEEYIKYRAKRIDEMLELAGGVSYDEYVKAIKESVVHGSQVLLQRDLDEIWVNNYNPEWIVAWNANHDLQPVLDFFAVITYVTDYWAKPDEGLTQVLREAANELKSEPDQRKKCQQMANTFLTYRQMGEAEAYYKILPSLTLKYSSIDTVFVPSDKKSERSKFLMKLDESDANFTKGVEVKGGKEGLFLEKPDIIDKYCRRDCSENDALLELRPTQFGKMYEPFTRILNDKKLGEDDPDEIDGKNTLKKEKEDENLQVDMTEEEYEVAHYIITPRHDMRIALPKIIKIKDPVLGEVAIWRKRSFPKALRIHKKKKDIDPHRYFLSELILYHNYTSEQDLGCDDEKKCRDLYMSNKENIDFVKKMMLPYVDEVDEARYYVEQANENEQRVHNIGDTLDSKLEQDVLECQDEEEHIHPDFVQVDPENLEIENKLSQIKKTFQNIEIASAEELLTEARQLDNFQKQVLHIAVQFAQDIRIGRKARISNPKAPLVMVHGGAGSGKSTVIKVMYQYIHNILRKDGDNPDCPYVILSAFTGGAASNINGQTLHTLFSFNFGSGFQSLSDKNRDLKRTLYKNLKVLIIDEISLVDADLLYKIDLRLREIMQRDLPFGNVAIFALGDMMQIKPVKGRYIMQCPKSQQFLLTYELDSLWHKFECIILEKNHRQGDDQIYAELLNRVRIGEETKEDIETLKNRVRNEKHKDIRCEKDALYLFGTNKKVNQMNDRRLKALGGEAKIIKAICLHKTIKNFKPPVNNSGNINNTPLQQELRIKIGAKVMLTYNVDTSDGLTNGARGELIGIEESKKGDISKLIIRFEMESHGRDKRRQNPSIEKRYPGGTPIERVNFSFSISKSRKSVINTANVIQFPVKLAFACTGHKIQGATIMKPLKLVIDVKDIWMAAIAYVMLSRICALWQLYILNEFDETKMYPHKQALEEMKRLESISKNKNLSEWQKNIHGNVKIISLNCRSLRKHIEDIISDEFLLQSHVICLQETWIENDENFKNFCIPNYKLHLNSNGRGKGVAIYIKGNHMKHVTDIKEKYMQISLFTSNEFDLIVLYRSQNGCHEDLQRHLELLMNKEKPILIVGDFNFCHLKDTNVTKLYLQRNNFSQIVKEPTHIEGNLLDHAYVRDFGNIHQYKTELHSKYYSDHKAIAVIVKKEL